MADGAGCRLPDAPCFGGAVYFAGPPPYVPPRRSDVRTADSGGTTSAGHPCPNLAISGSAAMRAETEAIVDEIQQGMALLRRHL